MTPVEEERLRIPAKLDARAKIEHLAKKTIAMARREVDPYVDIPSRTLSNVTFSRRKKIIEMGDATQRRSLFNLNQGAQVHADAPGRPPVAPSSSTNRRRPASATSTT